MQIPYEIEVILLYALVYGRTGPWNQLNVVFIADVVHRNLYKLKRLWEVEKESYIENTGLKGYHEITRLYIYIHYL